MLIEPDTSGVVHHAESPQPAAAIQAAPSFEPTDLGNAERLVAQHGHDLRYVHPWRSWLVWDGRRWKKDDTGEVYRRAKTTVRDIQLEALHAPDETTKRELENHALDSEDERRIKAMVRLAETESRVLVALDEIDAHPWLLNVLNGTIDLRTGVLKEHQPKDLITKLITVDYDPNATAPTFEAFLDRITAETADQQGFLRRAIGYSLTGDTSEQCLFMLHGPGANGKSTLVETILGLLANMRDNRTSRPFSRRAREVIGYGTTSRGYRVPGS